MVAGSTEESIFGLVLPLQDRPYLLPGGLSWRVARSSAGAHGGERPADRVPDNDEEGGEYEEDHKPEDGDIDEQFVYGDVYGEELVVALEESRTPAGEPQGPKE
jgi:hypothetical protein